MPSSYGKDRDKIIARLRRIEGQLRGIQRMVEEEKYCVDVLTQISSVIAATEKAGLLILEGHLQGCVQDGVVEGDGEESVRELVDVVERFMRS